MIKQFFGNSKRVFLGCLIVLLVAGCATNEKLTSFSSALPPVIRREEGPAATKTEALKEYEFKGPEVAGEYFETDLRVVLEDLAAQSGQTIITTQDVQGPVSLRFKDIPLEKALSLVLFSGHYVFRETDGVYFVGTADPLSPSAAQLMKTELMATTRPAEEVSSLLSDVYSKYVTVGKGETVSHKLMITAPVYLIAKVKQEVEAIDTPRPQIVIEVVVVETSQSKNLSLGIDWSKNLGFNARGQIDVEKGLEWGYGSEVMFDFLSSVRVLAQKGEIELKAQPKIVTIEGKEAEISLMTKQYFRTFEPDRFSTRAGYYGYQRLESIESGISLKVTPWVTRDNEILLSIEPEISGIAENGNGGNLPVITQRKVKTNIRVRSHETIVIGGMYKHLKESSKAGIPFLSKLPLVDIPLSNRDKSSLEREITIFLTPYFLD